MGFGIYKWVIFIASIFACWCGPLMGYSEEAKTLRSEGITGTIEEIVSKRIATLDRLPVRGYVLGNTGQQRQRVYQEHLQLPQEIFQLNGRTRKNSRVLYHISFSRSLRQKYLYLKEIGRRESWLTGWNLKRNYRMTESCKEWCRQECHQPWQTAS